MFSIVSCQKETDIADQSQTSNQSADSSADSISKKVNFTNNANCDVFIGKIISKEKVEGQTSFPNIVNADDYERNIYTVKVEK